MIDRRAINILYNDQVGKKLVEDFYQLLVVYSQNEKISLKEDLSQFIVEEYHLSKMEQK